MEEIDISQLLSYFKSKIIYVIFAMSLAFCLSSIYVNKFRILEYTSSTTILLTQASDQTAISSTDVSLNNSLVTTYSAIIKSKKVLNQVIEKNGLDFEYLELYNKISVNEVNDTSIIQVSVTDVDNELAADIANSIAEVFTSEIVDIYNIENISIIDEAEVSEVSSSTPAFKIIGISVIAGAFVAAAIIFIIFYFDTTLKNEEDIERVTGLPVIGIVPISREKIKKSIHRKYYDDLARKQKVHEILPIERKFKNKENTEVGIQILSTVSNEKMNDVHQINDELQSIDKNENIKVTTAKPAKTKKKK